MNEKIVKNQHHIKPSLDFSWILLVALFWLKPEIILTLNLSELPIFNDCRIGLRYHFLDKILIANQLIFILVSHSEPQ